jgi:signal transduction histidine kinase
VDADAMQMRQLFQNLIANALKFQKPGVPPVVAVSGVPADVHGNRVEITVADNGIGFDEKYLDRIFTVFQRLHGRHAYEGTGVGLAVVRRIAERHGGSVTAASEPGRGSTFVVTLPVSQHAGDSDR